MLGNSLSNAVLSIDDKQIFNSILEYAGNSNNAWTPVHQINIGPIPIASGQVVKVSAASDNLYIVEEK